VKIIMKHFLSILALCLVFTLSPTSSEFLRTGGSNFYYGNDKVFLSGTNFAWNSYGYDFGNGAYDSNSKAIFEDWIRQIRGGGGNTLRIWVHIEGDNTPEFDGNGNVVAPDRTGTFIGDLERFLDYAYEQEVFVILVLWNGAVMRNNNYKNLIMDDAKLTSYINNALVPAVRALKGKPSLAAWEIMNEPEGSILIGPNANPCFDTTVLAGSGAGWTGNNIPMERFLRFINWQSAAIHTEDPKALVTLGSWSERPQTDQFGYRNYYKDSCLRDAGGRANGIIDFFQIHSYTWEGAWAQYSPFRIDRWAYNENDKPFIIGEFAESCSQGEGIAGLFDWGYVKGYNGVLVWQFNEGGECSDSRAVQLEGMRALRDRNDQSDGNGGLVNVDIRY